MMKQILAAVGMICCVVSAAETWNGSPGGAATPPSVTVSKSETGGAEYLVSVEAPGRYQGVTATFSEPVDLRKYAAVEFEFSHNLTKRPMAVALNFRQFGGAIQGKVTVQDDSWQKVTFQLKPENFTGDGCKDGALGICKELLIYPYSALKAPGEYLKIRNFRLIPKDKSELEAESAVPLLQSVRDGNITWIGSKGGAAVPPSIVRSETKGHGTEYRFNVEEPGKYQGIVAVFSEPVDLRKYAAVEFEFGHNLTKRPMAMALHFRQATGVVQGKTVVQSDQWHKVTFQLTQDSFIGDGCRNGTLGLCRELTIYPYAALKAPGEYLKIRNFRFVPKDEAGASRVLSVTNYRYLTAPPNGDPANNALTDGNKRANVHYKEYSEDPEILFDLGGCYALDSLAVDAFAAPSHNFSNIAILTSMDGNKWFAGGNLRNSESGAKPRATTYVFKTSGRPIVGRYFKLKAARPRSDFSVDLAEVTFVGHIPSAEEVSAAAAVNYDVGPTMPKRDGANYAEVNSGDWRFWVSRRNGVVNGVWYRNKLIVERFAPRYVLQSRAADTKVSGYDDKVESIRSTADSVTVIATNAKLPGLAVERTWKAEGNALTEKVTVINRGQKRRLFLQIATETIFARKFRAPGFYEMPSSSLYDGMYRFPTSEIIMDRALTNTPCLALENGRTNQTVLHYRHRFNDRFTYFNTGTEEDQLQLFRANGWLLTSATIVPADKPRQSFENRFSVTAGGMLKAYDEYIHLPEVKAFRDRIDRAKSVRDVRMSIDAGWDGEWPAARKRVMANYVRAFSHRGTLSACELVDLDGIWGDLPVEGHFRGHFGERRSTAELRQSLIDLRKTHPTLRLGLYTWFNSAFPWSTPFKKHPEWFVKTLRSGAKAAWFPRVNVNYLRFFGIPESRREAVDQIVRFMDYYQQDSWYIDGGKAGTYAKDWDTMRIDDPNGQTDFYMEVREAIRKNHPERFIVFNEAENPVADMGFLESAGDIMTGDWRRGAIIAWKFKMYSYLDPLHQSIYVYWLPSSDGIYHNYIAGLGLLPNYNNRFFNARDLPYTGARYDIRLAEIRDAAVSPDWRLDWNELLECMALIQQNNGWIFMQYHGDTPTVREVSADAEALGLKDRSKPVYLWHYTIRNGKKYPGIFGERQISKAYGETGWVADRAATVRYLGKQPWSQRISGKFEQRRDEAQLLMASQVPAVVLSIENDPMHYYLAGQPGIELDGDREKLTVRNEYDFAEIGMILEDGQVPAAVKVNGRDTAFTIRTDRNFRCAVFKVGKGDSVAEFAYTAATPVNATALDVARTGRRLEVKVVPENAPVQVYGDGALVLSRVGSFTLELPETVRDGDYEVVSGALKKTVTLRGLGSPMKFEPILASFPERHDIQPVNRKIRGVEVLKQAASYVDSSCEAHADPDKLKLVIGTLPFYESPYNRANAAFNLRSKRFMKLRIVNGAVDHTRFDYVPARHTYKSGDPHTFIGIVLDFGTKSGKMRRSMAGLGLQAERNAKPNTSPFFWGSRETPSHVYQLLPMLYDPDFEEKTCWIDLATLGAPADWNGELWFTLSLGNLCPNRRFEVEILATADRLPSGTSAVVPVELTVKKPPVTYAVPRVSGAADLAKLPVLGKMILDTRTSPVRLETSVKAAYDDDNLYFFYDCRETEGHIPNCSMGKRGKPYNGDSVEFFIQRTDNPGQAMHGVADFEENLFCETLPFRKNPGQPNVNFQSMPFKVDITRNSPHWTALITLPWSAIGGKPASGKALGFNLMRNRFEQGKESNYTLSNNMEYLSADQCRMVLK